MTDGGPRLSRREFVAACGATPLGGCSSALGFRRSESDWATIQRDPGHTGYVPDDEVPKRGLVGGWDFETAHDGLLYQPPVFTDETLFTASESTLYALAAEEGDVRWRRRRTTTNTEGETVRFGVGDILCGRDCAFVTWNALYENDRLTAHDARTGERRWELESNTTVGAVLPVDDTLYVVATMPDGQQLLALDPATGEERWRRSVNVESEPPLAYAGGSLFSASYRDIAESFMGWWDVRAFDAETGTRRWSHRVKGYRASDPTLTVADGRVYFGTGPHELFALDARDGSELWTYSLEGGNTDTAHAPVVDEDTVYVANLSNVTALDAETGERRWRYGEARLPFETLANRYPVLAGDTLLVPEEVTWLALDADTGEKVYRHGPYADGLVGVAPLVVDGVLYTASGDSMYAVAESW